MKNITVTDTPQKLKLGNGDIPVIQNLGSADVYFGRDDSVTSSNGLKLGNGVGYAFDKTLGEAQWDGVWVVTASGTADVRYGSVG